MENNNKLILVDPPRSVWCELLLAFFSFSLSTPFWFYSRVKELKLMSNDKLSPWMWCFVPFFGVFQIFALPKFFKEIEKVGIADSNNTPKIIKFFIIVLAVSTTFFIHITNKIEVPFWLIFLALFFWATVIAFFQSRFNLIKNKNDFLNFKENKFYFKVWEWFLLIIGAPFTVFVFYITVIQPSINFSENINKGDVVEVSDHLFEMKVNESGWKKVKIGSYSDGSALLELGGPLLDMQLIVFEHGHDVTYDSLSYWRQGDFSGEISSASCEQIRKFEKHNFSVSIFLICEGSWLGEKVLYLSKIIKTKKGYYELYGYFTSYDVSFDKHKGSFIATAEGFKSK